MYQVGLVTTIVGCIVFLAGASVGVPSVFTTADPERRLRLITESLARWQMAQIPYAIGPLTAAVGVGLIGMALRGVGGGLIFGAATLLLIGAGWWSYSCRLRAADHVAFVRGTLPGRPFRTYVVLTLVGLAGFGVGLLLIDAPRWLGWMVLAADLGFAMVYWVTRDLPPFVFYVVLLIVGLAL